MALGLDVVAVLLFVVIGRASHRHHEDLEGVASTAWPFLAGLGVSWALLAAGRAARRRQARAPGGRRSPLSAANGAALCASTVAVGMVLRVIAGQGTAPSFIAVAIAFLGACMVGGRAAANVLSRRLARPAGRG